PWRLFYSQATAPPQPSTLSLHDALPISPRAHERLAPIRPLPAPCCGSGRRRSRRWQRSDPRLGLRAAARRSYETAARLTTSLPRSEEHTSELQSLRHLVCRLLLEKKKSS